MNTLLHIDQKLHIFYCKGAWDVSHAFALQETTTLSLSHITTIDGSQLERLDTVGAWFIARLKQRYAMHLQGFSEAQLALIETVQAHDTPLQTKRTSSASEQPFPQLEQLGRKTVKQLSATKLFFDFVGETAVYLFRAVVRPLRMRWRAVFMTIESSGYYALPIIALLSFLIGIVLAYQMGLQLQNYGANIFVVNFLGLAVLREFAPLITAIIVAGRTGSAFTAEIGTMKVNQEIDALNTMGVSPQNLLVVPKLVGLFIALPLLTVWSTLFSLMGGMFMANVMLDIQYVDFIKRFQDVLSVRHYWVGMVKTPAFAAIIGLVGCYQGLQVQGSADSVGKKTTRSVVQAIFFIIVADAFFSILFNEFGL